MSKDNIDLKHTLSFIMISEKQLNPIKALIRHEPKLNASISFNTKDRYPSVKPNDE